MKYNLLIISLLILFAVSCQTPVARKRMDLAGNWQFAMDPGDKGISEAWFNRALTDSLKLPGSLTSNGKGEEIAVKTPWTGEIVDSSYFKKPEYARYRQPGNIKIPFWLQPLKYYKGAAWYQKEVTIPQDWQGKLVDLFLERCHWESHLWVDGK